MTESIFIMILLSIPINLMVSGVFSAKNAPDRLLIKGEVYDFSFLHLYSFHVA